MKTIALKLRALVLLLLVFAMFATVMGTTVAAVEASAGIESSEQQNTPNNTGDVENLTGWFDITSGPDGLKVTLTPDKEALKGISVEQIKSLATDLIAAIKGLVTDDLVDDVLGGASLNDDDFFTVVLDNYILDNFGENADKVEFFKTIVKDSAEEEKFIDYVCNTLLANAIKFGAVAVEDLPTAEEIAADINDYIDDAVNEKIEEITENLTDYVNEYVDELAADYASWLLGDDTVSISEDVKNIVNGKIATYVRELATAYLNGEYKDSTDVFEKLINDYFDDELYTKLIENVTTYLENGTTGNSSLDALIKDAIGEYVKDHFLSEGYTDYLEQFVTYVKTGVVEDEDMKSLYDSFIEDIEVNIDAWMTEYLANKIEGAAISGTNILADFLNEKYDDAYLTEEIKKEAGKRLDDALAGNNPELYQQILDELYGVLENTDSEEYKRIVDEINNILGDKESNEYQDMLSEIKGILNDPTTPEYQEVLGELENILKNHDSAEYKEIVTEFDKKVAGVLAGTEPELEDEFKTKLFAEYKEENPDFDESAFETYYEENKETLINDYVAENKETLIDEYVEDHKTEIIENYVDDNIDAIIEEYLNENMDDIIKDYVEANEEEIIEEYINDNKDEIINDYVNDNKNDLILEAYKEIRSRWADAAEKRTLLDEIWIEILAEDENGNLVNADLIDKVIKDEIENFWALHSGDDFIRDYALDLWNSSVEDEGYKAEIKALIEKKLNEGSNENKEELIDQVIGGMQTAELVSYLRDMVSEVTDEEKVAVEKAINEKINSAIYTDDGKFTPDVQDIVDGELADVKADVLKALENGDITTLDQTVQDKINEICNDYFATDYQGLFGADGRLAAITAAFKTAYTAALETEAFTPSDIFTLLESVKIGEYAGELYLIYGKEDGATGAPHIYVESIKELLKTIPTHTEILEMTEDTLELSYTLSVKVKDFDAPVEFTVTVEFAGKSLDYIKRAITVIVNHIDFGVRSDGTIVFDVKMPAIITNAILKACNTTRIPDSIKNKVFTALGKTPDDAYALFMDLTYEEVLTLVEKVDFNEILNKDEIVKYRDFVNKYLPDIDLENLETEDVVNKLREYAGYYNTLKNYVVKAYSYVPERVKSLSIASLYEGNGTFGFAGSVERIDLAPIIYEVVALVNEDYALTVANLLDKAVIENLSVDVSVSFYNLYSVDFYKPGADTAYRAGFLPTGASFKTFAALTSVDGYAVKGWYELLENGEIGAELTKMPARDVKVVAVLVNDTVEFDPTLVTLGGATYTGSAITPTEITNANTDGLDIYTLEIVGNPSGTNAGEYTANIKATVKDEYKYTHKLLINGAEYNEYTFECKWTIAKAVIKVTPAGLANSEALIYTGSDLTVSLLNPEVNPEQILVNFVTETLTAKEVGTYAAKVILTLTEALKGNYIIELNAVDGITIGEFDEATESVLYTVAWEIVMPPVSTPVVLDPTLVTLGGATYTGSAITPTEIINANTDNLDLYTLEIVGNPSGINAGEYTVNIKATVKDEYKLTHKLVVNGEEYTEYTFECKWTIAKAVIKVTPLGLANSETLIYNGSDITVALLNPEVNPEQILVNFVTETLTAKNAGAYAAKVVLTLTEALKGNCIIELTEVDGITAGEFDEATDSVEYTVAWEIAKATFDVSDLTLAPDFVGCERDKFYQDGVEKVYVLKKDGAVAILPDYIIAKVLYNGNEAAPTLAGDYTVTVIIAVAEDFANNYEIAGDVSAITAQFKIHEKTALDLSSSALIPDGFELNEDNEVTVDEQNKAFKLDATALSVLEGVSYEIVYYDAQGNKLTQAPKDAGEYYVCIELTGDSIYSHTISSDLKVEFKIVEETPIVQTVVDPATDITDWTLDFVYAPGKTFIPSFKSDIFAGEIILGGNETVPGVYSVTFKITLKDPVNYKFADGSSEVQLEKMWSISKYNINSSGILPSNKTVTFDGNIKKLDSVSLDKNVISTLTVKDLFTIKSDLVSVSGEKIDFKNPGVYVYSFTVTLNDAYKAYYSIDGADSVVVERTLTIVKSSSGKTETNITLGNSTIGSVVTASPIPDSYKMQASDVSHIYDNCYFVAKLAQEYPGKVANVLLAYDLGFADESGKISLNGEFTVTLNVPEEIKNNANLLIVYINDDGEVAEIFDKIPSEGNTISFKTTHFSAYAVIEVVDAPVVVETSYWWVYLIIALAVVGIIVLVIILIIKKRGKPSAEPTDGATAPKAPVEDAPVEEASIEETVEAPVKEAPIEEPAAKEAPAEEIPVEEASIEETVEAPVEEAPIEEPTAEEAPAEEIPVEEASIEETVEAPVEEAPIEEPAAKEAPAEEIPVEEASIEETVEAPVKEAPIEEPTVEETPAVEEAPAEVAPVIVSGDGEEAFGKRIINGQVVLVSYRSSYMSRLIQSDSEIQDYYTAIKNALLSYKGVKARTSWNFESFNKGRIQCAKLNLKGRALLVYLGLEPSEYSVAKYHFTDVSDKPKFDKVPMLMKVKSDRGLKYVLELIEEMMKKLEIPQGEIPTVDYHMPYETTEALVNKDLVKVILPPGVTLDENASIASVDVSELIDNAGKSTEEETPTEVAAVEAPIEEPIVEEAPAEEAPIEEPIVEEAPVEEAPIEEPVVEEAPVEEAPIEEPTVEEAPIEEAHIEVHVDAVHADELVSDAEAEEQIEFIERTVTVKGTKLAEVNLDTICENYEDDETVDIVSLIKKHLVTKNAGKIKVLARGTMTKRLVIIADKFSLQAVKMITLAGGHAEQLK